MIILKYIIILTIGFIVFGIAEASDEGISTLMIFLFTIAIIFLLCIISTN